MELGIVRVHLRSPAGRYSRMVNVRFGASPRHEGGTTTVAKSIILRDECCKIKSWLEPLRVERHGLSWWLVVSEATLLHTKKFLEKRQCGWPTWAELQDKDTKASSGACGRSPPTLPSQLQNLWERRMQVKVEWPWEWRESGFVLGGQSSGEHLRTSCGEATTLRAEKGQASQERRTQPAHLRQRAHSSIWESQHVQRVQAPRNDSSVWRRDQGSQGGSSVRGGDQGAHAAQQRGSPDPNPRWLAGRQDAVYCSRDRGARDGQLQTACRRVLWSSTVGKERTLESFSKSELDLTITTEIT